MPKLDRSDGGALLALAGVAVMAGGLWLVLPALALILVGAVLLYLGRRLI